MSKSRSERALASWRTTIGERRSSPKASASAINSRFIRVFKRALEPNNNSSFSRSAVSSSCSAWIRCCSNFAKWRSFKSSMASAWRSDNVKRCMSIDLGFSSSRIMAIISSMLRYATNRPSKRCKRSSTLSKRCCKRRVTVSIRKDSHSFKIVLKPLT